MKAYGQLRAPATLPPWKEPLVPSLGTQSWSGGGGKEKNSQPLPELEPLMIQPIAQQTLASTSLLQFMSVLCLVCILQWLTSWFRDF